MNSDKVVTNSKKWVSFGLDIAPFVGTGKGLTELFSGRDLITNEKLSGFDRAMSLVGIIPIAGPFLKGSSKAVKYIRRAVAISEGANTVNTSRNCAGNIMYTLNSICGADE